MNGSMLNDRRSTQTRVSPSINLKLTIIIIIIIITIITNNTLFTVVNKLSKQLYRRNLLFTNLSIKMNMIPIKVNLYHYEMNRFRRFVNDILFFTIINTFCHSISFQLKYMMVFLILSKED